MYLPRLLSQAKSPGPERVRRAWPWICLLALLMLAGAFRTGGAAADAEADPLLEDLNYSVDVLIWKDAARGRITLKKVGAGKYRAEVSGRPQGMLKLIAGSDREERIQTEMAWRQGRLMPLVYREESRRRGKLNLKEYRFDYEQGRLEMWVLKDEKMVRKWHTALTGPVYDPLSGFYNCRLGLLGPIRDGQVFRLQGIPYPKPEHIEVRVGPKTAEGRKTMIIVANEAYKDKPEPVFAFFDGQMVPKHAWTRVWGYGKVTGVLLPGSKALQSLRPDVAAGRRSDAAPGG